MTILDVLEYNSIAAPVFARGLALFALGAGLSRLWAADRLNRRDHDEKRLCASLATAWFVLALVFGMLGK